MKYGKNQWARISSLLVRKSAKQCKARWYEWLDPSIKKTEWTREEDERLLHLAKLMPTQWRTIAPIVGRTAAQCLERYEKLLDAACRGEEGYEGSEDPRRLRPGEIDPNPESKAARPDPVDMEEDEKEMLSEARARLANTRGKKAKRKAREKQLEEARRLASLQKRRELKAAGIVSHGGGRRIQGIDYNNEVAFEKRAPAGFFDTSAEKTAERAQADKPFKPVTLAELEGTRRSDIETALRKRDRQRQSVLERHDTPAALAQQAAGDGGERKRSRLMLPAPAVSDAEREQLARLCAAGGSEAVLLAEGGEGGSDATRALLTDYRATPGVAAPLRTPRVPTHDGRDFLLQEAQNLARLQQGATPLMGGENPELHASDFSGATPRKRLQATPHPLAPQGATPARLLGDTPLRDGLGINADEAAREGRAHAEQLRSELRLGLASLPAPRNEYQVVVPEMEADVEEAIAEADAVDLEEARAAAAAAEEAEAMRRRSHAMQRGLPRPLGAPPSLLSAAAASPAEAMLRCELALLVAYDAGLAAGGAPAPPLEQFPEEALLAAGELVRQEAQELRNELGHEQDGPEAHLAARDAVAPHAQPRAAFEIARAEMERQARRAAKLDARAVVTTTGYQRRAEELQSRLEKAVASVASRSAELAAFQCLHSQEVRAAPLRIEALAGEVEAQAARGAALQARYGGLAYVSR